MSPVRHPGGSAPAAGGDLVADSAAVQCQLTSCFIVTRCTSSGIVCGVKCSMCGRALVWSGRGRRPEVCGQRCRKRKSRSKLPQALTELMRWTGRDGKRPITVDGRPASSTKPRTWTEFRAVCDRPNGIMLGDGLACWDLDDVVNDKGQVSPEAMAIINDIEPMWLELSMSGRGIHAFVEGSDKSFVGKNVSYFSWGRFIAVTGRRFHLPVT